MGRLSKLYSGRWIAVGVVIVMLLGLVLALSRRGGGNEVTSPPLAIAETAPPALPTATADVEPVPPATSISTQPTTSTDTLQFPTATAGLSSGTVAQQSEPSPTTLPQTPALRQVPVCGVECVKVGVTLENFPGPFSAISDFGVLSGRMPDLVMFFQAWGDADAAFKDWLSRLSDMDVAPLITWEPWRRDEFLNQSQFTLQSILAGHHDAYIDDWAHHSAAHGKPIYLRFAHEMNTPRDTVYWYPWQGDPETYVAAWRYVHDRFEAAGATNVEWVWSAAWMNQDAQAYFPGDEYVDWVGLTVLNFGTTVEGPGWRSFETLYTETDDGVTQSERAASFGKPVMITELASVEQGGDKGEWIAEIGPTLQSKFPEIRAIVWNNYGTARHVPEADWRVNSSDRALAGWRKLMSYPYITSPATRMRAAWARTDRPVAWGRVDRTWMWAPEPFTDVHDEEYHDAPDGTRNVRYYDKSRMEITDPDGDWASPWYVTNGLLATELITGRIQRGDNSFDQWQPAQVNVAGDVDDPFAPTYASFTGLLGWDALPVGTTLTQRLRRDGSVVVEAALAEYRVKSAYVVPETGHTVAEPFWNFMNSTGLVWVFGQFIEDHLFESPFFATGFPITEAYWATVKVAGTPRNVLVQCFERRCLTYTPDNPPGWQVEAGNVGRHYFAWRYGA